jgi:hypothetical protein
LACSFFDFCIVHFEILVEDASGKTLLEQVVPKILGPKGKPNQYRIVNIQELKYRVMASLPRQQSRTLPWDVILMQTLAIQLRAYSKALIRKHGVVVIVVDVDKRNSRLFRGKLEEVFQTNAPNLEGGVRLAVEEIEAWILGDPAAVRHAYPLVKEYVLTSYEQDAACGTWEILADALFHGGSERLTELGYPLIGREKCRWADNIGQYMDVDTNRSPSFRAFRDLLRHWADT